jgi:hypothetical protein
MVTTLSTIIDDIGVVGHPTINRKILKLGDKKGDKMVDKQHRTYKNPERVIIG